jgi:hypothetical protein
MRYTFLLLACVSVASAGLRLKRVAVVESGPWADGVMVCYDTDHDGEGELIFNNGGWGGCRCWSIVEYRPVNRYEMVQSDTGQWPPPPGEIHTGLFWPFDAGDVDRDGKADLAGQLYYRDSLDSMRNLVCTLESPDSLSYPDSLNWSAPLYPSSSALTECAYTDLDVDGRREVLTHYGATMVLENVADDRESLVYSGLPSNIGAYAVRDFDLNGRTDYGCNHWNGVRVCECVGDNQFAQVCSLGINLINGFDIFSGNDADQNGRPEFFIVNERYGGSGWKLLLYMFEATAEHEYTYWLLDSEQLGMGLDPAPKVSLCADLDGDSMEEVIWSCCTHGYVLKATGPHQFRRELRFSHDHGPAALCNAADFNGNGYKELFVGSCDKISVFEVEPVRVMYPAYRRETLVAGDTCVIRWRVYTPPRCDSVSLFLKTDTVVPNGERFWRLDTIASGLPPTESSYVWVVPDTTLPWAKILAIAYGPGWQYDESDSAFAIIPAGIAAAKLVPPTEWSLSVIPNPAGERAEIRYDVPLASDVSLSMYDATGRLVSNLATGPHQPGRYAVPVSVRRAQPQVSRGEPEWLTPAAGGVYLVRLKAGSFTATRKLVVQH